MLRYKLTMFDVTSKQNRFYGKGFPVFFTIPSYQVPEILENEASFNTLTANYEYSRSNTDNLPLPVQMQLSEKLETFFIAFLESALNFEHFEKK